MTVRGIFSPGHLLQSVPALTPVPLLDSFIYVPIVRRGVTLKFLVDTGADMTVLHPHSLRLLLGQREWDLVRSSPIERVAGAGHGLPHYLVDAVVAFTHDDGSLDAESLTLWIAEPNPQNVSQESLLGRDVLSRFVTTFEGIATFTLDRP